MKRSFSNVRLDVLNIKEYLEKQHDMLNSELSELQSQLFSVKRELKDSKKTLGEDYVKKDALEKRVKTQIKNVKKLRNEVEDSDSRVNKLNRNLSKLERESISPSEFNKKTRVMSKELSEIRDELDEEFELIGEELRDIKKELSKELIREQAKLLDKKIRKLDRSLEEVDDLKEDLRQILEKANKREKVKKEVVKLEKKITKRPFYRQVWDGVVDFFEEEPEVKAEKRPKKKVKELSVPEKIWLAVVDFFTEEVEEKPKKDRNLLPILFLVFLVLAILGVLAFVYYDDILLAADGLFGDKNMTSVEISRLEEPPEHIVITVNETNFVNLIPNASDPDKEEFTYIFSYPLNKSGQWQTQEGDAGIYPITVVVSDGESETTLEFTLVVKPLQS